MNSADRPQNGEVFEFRTIVWRYQGPSAWFFATLPFDVSDEIDAIDEVRRAGAKRGFGSVPVEVTVGSSTWRTSVFPDRRAESYIVPVKAAIRRAERIDDGDAVSMTIRLVTD